MASSVQAYSVTITNTNSTNTTPSDGFVDNLGVENYGLTFKTTPSGLTLALCKAKRRANVRFREIVTQLQMIANCYIPPVSISSDATAKTEASSFAFQIYAEHGDASLVTADELNDGVTLSSTDCIKRCIARALKADLFKEIDIFDPTSSQSTPVSTTSVPRFGVRILASSFEIGAYEANLTTGEAMIVVAAI